MEKVYIVAAQRTPIGKFNGQLASKTAVELGAISIKAALKKAGLTGADVDQVLMGNVIQAGTGQNPARQAAIKAGLGEQVPAITINDVCASGMSSVDLAASLIRAGQAQVIIAGGMESMSQAPYVLPRARNGYRFGNGTLLDAMQSDALNDVYGGYPMGITAENINDKYQITRQQQDEFAFTSHQRAVKAQKAGYFDSEIVPVEVKQKRTTITVTTDEAPRPDTSVEALGKLKPVFKADGSVTAGNASGINDGGAALVLASETAVERLELTPLAEWQGSAIVGLDPALMGLGPYYAINKLLADQQLSADEVETYEINEAFATQAIVCQDLLHLDPAAVNPWGGALALGHPVGCSGARIIVTMINEMHKDNHELGIASLCVGGGMGEAVLLKKM
ncbi:acetyl-CoA C-acetyltransferase [Limosilactobacillus sp. RRLNB_1_1]|uniref:acetyl-CoA C-acetyltransferase n=1 Tax=Limosilactobacillus albertensis TaxID=2759752 RepID=A0A7W3Y8P1_9LACO|nr:acetyl-CoA C-acetyltransferase [Limosilactobacillus albertensis]MBB1069851.1 acetyl-CoA C-acetyltransferase [Limosilactobacillus albertensis]MCD7117089.1 acetyl-CoA C-acetyltransferase [Limosilactobacillus albertensis]MCD7128693.1 acetyl-CoA C-acetyltransferase [Limosilactobacillus albertensis]